MSLHPQAIEAIPEDTLRVARAAFPKGKNPIMVLRDHLSSLFSDQDFLALYSACVRLLIYPSALELCGHLTLVCLDHPRSVATLVCSIRGTNSSGTETHAISSSFLDI